MDSIESMLIGQGQPTAPALPPLKVFSVERVDARGEDTVVQVVAHKAVIEGGTLYFITFGDRGDMSITRAFASFETMEEVGTVPAASRGIGN